MNDLSLQDTDYTASSQPALMDISALRRTFMHSNGSTSDEVIDTLVCALESTISSLRKVTLARRAITRVHTIQAGVALADIAQRVADAFHTNSTDLTGHRRTQHVAYTRQVAMYLCRKMTDCSFVSIGEFFAHHHSTVIFAYQKIERRVQQDAAFRRFIETLTDQIRRDEATTTDD